jgi:hypothetical protein
VKCMQRTRQQNHSLSPESGRRCSDKEEAHRNSYQLYVVLYIPRDRSAGKSLTSFTSPLSSCFLRTVQRLSNETLSPACMRIRFCLWPNNPDSAQKERNDPLYGLIFMRTF